MHYSVEIRNNATGETRLWRGGTGQVTFDDAEDLTSFLQFLWMDGNNACDCNRALFFAESGGEDDPDVDCGEGGFSVSCLVCENGLVIPIDG